MIESQLIWLSVSMIDFGKNLTSVRKLRQLTQLELATLLDVQPRMVGRWEQGVAKPKFDYIVKLAQILEVSLDYLILGEEGQNRPEFEIQNKRLKELCKHVDQLNNDDQDMICHFLDMAVKQNQVQKLMTRAG